MNYPFEEWCFPKYIRIQSVPHRKHHFCATETTRLILFGDTVAVYCENHAEHTSTMSGQNADNLYTYKNSVRTSQETHYASATKPNRLMLFGEIIAVYCENHIEHTNTLCGGQNAELFFLILRRTVTRHQTGVPLRDMLWYLARTDSETCRKKLPW
jgi:hypothetical protein